MACNIEARGWKDNFDLQITNFHDHCLSSGLSETSCESAATMNLFPTKENDMTPLQYFTPLNLFPHLSAEEIPNIPNSSVGKFGTKERKAAQLTIFYGGQVIVFDDFPAEKAMEIMCFASGGVSSTQNSSSFDFTQSQPSFPPVSVRISSDSTRPIPPNTANTLIQRHPQSPSGPGIADLPIARKVSLHRFLEKRKERIAER